MALSDNMLLQSLIKICGSKNVCNNTEILEEYSKDMSFIIGKAPRLVVWPSKADQILKIIKLANQMKFPVIPISSGSHVRYYGITIPKKENCVIIDLSRMKKIISIDKKNRVIIIEPGVTFGQLIPMLEKYNLKLSIPLFPRCNISVLASFLEREPPTTPRYHWDSSDPLLCIEVIFGTGDLFRTGSAAGPGTIKDQKSKGIAQVNPMGPTQFSLFRVIQGAQGSLGIVTWVSLKVELKPTVQKVFRVGSEDLQELLNLQRELIKYRLCDETFILNDLNFASLLKKTRLEIEHMVPTISKWTLIYVISGRGELANEKINYLEGDIKEILIKFNLANKIINNDNINSAIIELISKVDLNSWKDRFSGAHCSFFFLSQYEKIQEHISRVQSSGFENIGVYLQPLNQGTSNHCEFNFFYDPKDKARLSSLKDLIFQTTTTLMDNGAFFNRPYDIWSKEVYKRHQGATTVALKKLKSIFDPNNILNPGVLCFDE
jgi:hypothetical protein